MKQRPSMSFLSKSCNLPEDCCLKQLCYSRSLFEIATLRRLLFQTTNSIKIAEWDFMQLYSFRGGEDHSDFPVSLLKRVSGLLRWEYKNPSSYPLQWKRKTLPIFAECSAFYHTLQKPSPLTTTEEHDLELVHKRLTTICDKALESNVPVVIDAEDTSIQPGIDCFTYWATVKYNKGTKPLVYGTVQAYLKDAGQRLFETKKAADKMGLPIGFKLVRGAYMSSERKLAHSLGVESPIHNSINDTHHCFNECASYMLDEVSSGPGGLILATHNLKSGKVCNFTALIIRLLCIFVIC
ncbi:proline dehydrogenase 2, mitochondrial-like [Helianthus annuus]|uniref:proline dehydrogenase 2, mitochondrial-like n=1 Tax=Helianthus annuus TaxID=4232 RepID=UPI000B905AB4|nr:proline dehydrogenase 2, mitochondrial-like [Helianthus annuus]